MLEEDFKFNCIILVEVIEADILVEILEVDFKLNCIILEDMLEVGTQELNLKLVIRILEYMLEVGTQELNLKRVNRTFMFLEDMQEGLQYLKSHSYLTLPFDNQVKLIILLLL